MPLSSPLAESMVRKPPVFDEVFVSLAPQVMRALRHLGVPDRDIDDLCQEVFLVVHQKLSTFEGRSSLRSWVYGICLRKASDHRKRAYLRREELSSTPPTADANTSEVHAESRAMLRKLDELLSRLDDDKRDVFVLYEVEELTMKEVAEVVGCPLQTAYSRLQAARTQLEAFVAQEAG